MTESGKTAQLSRSRRHAQPSIDRALRSLLSLVLLAAGVAVLGPTASAGGSSAVAAQAAARPNIVLVTTDDMAASDLAYMPKTRRLLGGAGTTFTNFLAPHPLCCPSRAQLLTGQYAQNNGVHHNEGLYGGYQALEEPDNTIASWLQAAGYRTSFVGKFLNYWSPADGIPGGWSNFDPLYRGVFKPYGYTAFRHGDPQLVENVHTSDYVARQTVRQIKRSSSLGEPFFVWASQVAPHRMLRRGEMVPPIPPARHARLFRGVQAPSLSSPSFNEPNVTDKPSYVQSTAEVDRDDINTWFQRRIRSLQAVDEGVQAAVDALRSAGELENTIFLFTSDNGSLLGQHRLTLKNFPYEEALDVPLLVRGPGFAAGIRSGATTSMIDLAPTFVAAAQGTAQRVMDGQSLLSVREREGADRPVLIQAGRGDEPWWWRGVHTRRFTYVSYADGFTELYDRRADPFQLTNVAGSADYLEVQARLETQFQRLKDCSGDTCW